MDLQILKDTKDLVDFDPNSLNRIYKINLVNKFLIAKSENPTLNQAQLCKMIGTSASSMKRIRIDLNISSPYRYDIPVKKHKKVNNKQPEIKIIEQQKPKSKSRPRKERLGMGEEVLNYINTSEENKGEVDELLKTKSHH